MAARPFKLIAVSPNTIEGVGITRGEAAFHNVLTHHCNPQESEGSEQLLERFDQQLEQVNWAGSPVVLVLSSHEISLRKLDFPFKDPKKIEQALVFELENELLEGVGFFSYTYTVVPRDDGSATVLVYLAPLATVHGLLQIFQERHLTPLKATFSAEALHQCHPTTGHRHYQVYLGLDEIFVSCILEGQVDALKSFPFAAARLRALVVGSNGDGAGKEEGIAPNVTTALREALPKTEEEAGPHPLAEQWRASLEELGEELMHFIRPHCVGEPFSLSLHGTLGAYFQWDPEAQTLAAPPPEGAFPEQEERPFVGILQELLPEPAVLTTSRGVNFFRSHSGLLPQLREFKRPLAAMAVLGVMMLALFSWNFATHISAQRHELEQLDARIRTLLKGVVPSNRATALGVRLLQERLTKLKKDRAASARFTNYDYEALGLLQELSLLFKNFPALTLRAVNVNPERFTLTGTTRSYNASESFKNRLAEFKRFRGKEPTITHQRTDQSITYRIVIER